MQVSCWSMFNTSPIVSMSEEGQIWWWGIECWIRFDSFGELKFQIHCTCLFDFWNTIRSGRVPTTPYLQYVLGTSSSKWIPVNRWAIQEPFPSACLFKPKFSTLNIVVSTWIPNSAKYHRRQEEHSLNYLEPLQIVEVQGPDRVLSHSTWSGFRVFCKSQRRCSTGSGHFDDRQNFPSIDQLHVACQQFLQHRNKVLIVGLTGNLLMPWVLHQSHFFCWV